MKLSAGAVSRFGPIVNPGKTNSDPGKEHGIGENCYAKKIDEHCGVPNPSQRDACIAPLRWLRFG